MRFSLPSIIITIMQKQRTLKQGNTQNGSKFPKRKSQTIAFSKTRSSKLLFPKRSAKIIDGSEKRKGVLQSAFELQNLRVFEKRSNGSLIPGMPHHSKL